MFILFIILIIFLLILLFVYWFNFLKVKKLFLNNVILICGSVGCGKTSFATYLGLMWKKLHKRSNIFSSFPIIIKKNKFKKIYSYILDYRSLVNFLSKNTNFPFKEKDFLICDELGLVLNSLSISKLETKKHERIGLFCKLIRHMLDSSIIFVEQSLSRIPKQIREKSDTFIKVKNVRSFFIFKVWKVNIFTNENDINKKVYSKRELKKMSASINYDGECYKTSFVSFINIFNRYHSRNLSFIREYCISLKPSHDKTLFTSLYVDKESLDYLGFDKMKDILND